MSHIGTIECQTSLDHAILEHLTRPELYTDDEGCTLGSLIDELRDNYQQDVGERILALIASRRAYVTEPLELADLNTYVFPICWTLGSTNRAEVENRFGPPHGIVVRNGKQAVTFDLYVENSDDHDLPVPSTSYAMREAANVDRPQDCAFPYTSILPSEALQVEFTFDEADILVEFEFKVGIRLT